MATEQSVLDALGTAMWDPQPTGNSDIKAQQLAFALGYPMTWRVVRTIEHIPTLEQEETKTEAKEVEEQVKAEETKKATETDQIMTANEPPTKEGESTREEAKEKQVETQGATQREEMQGEASAVDESKQVKQEEEEKDENAMEIEIDTSNKDVNDSTSNKKGNPEDTVELCIVDRIYAGEPGTGCDMWFNHQSAMMASHNWIEEGANPFQCKGGHLLPRQPLFEKGDKVEVLFENEWFEAKVLRRKEHTEGYRYQVFYSLDKSKQNGIPEERIRTLAAHQKKDPYELATQLGFGADWQAACTGNNRWKLTAPDGQLFTSKKAAWAFYTNQVAEIGATKDEGDPPWRTTDHDFLGRLVRWTQEHAVTARRTITVEQIGKVVGWIAETDVDQAGEPGFVSEKTGQPARLFHVHFDDEPSLHPYASYLVESQDLEEFELESCLIPENEIPSNKKARRGK